MNLYQKIVEVRKVAGGFSKDTKGYGYDYVSGNQILHKIKDKMNELGLLLIPKTQVGDWKIHEYVNNRGKDSIDFVVWGDMDYVWIDADDPEQRLEVSWAYYGQQNDISKAYGSALTYSERYFLLKALGLPTDEDDPDGRDTNSKEPYKKNPQKSFEENPPKDLIKEVESKAIEKGYTMEDVEKVVLKGFNKRVKDLNEKETRAVINRLASADKKKASEPSSEGSNSEDNNQEVVDQGSEKEQPKKSNTGHISAESIMPKGKHKGKKIKDIVKEDKSYAKYVADQFNDIEIRDTFRELLNQ